MRPAAGGELERAGVAPVARRPAGPRRRPSRPIASSSRSATLVCRVIRQRTGSERNGGLSPGLGMARATAVTRMNRDSASGRSSTLVRATTAFLVRTSNDASCVLSVRPPIQPLTACVRGVSIVWMPSSQSRVSSPVSERTNVCPSGMKSRSGSVTTIASPDGVVGLSQGSSRTCGHPDGQPALLGQRPDRRGGVRGQRPAEEGVRVRHEAVRLAGRADVPAAVEQRRGRHHRRERRIVIGGPLLRGRDSAENAICE